MLYDVSMETRHRINRVLYRERVVRLGDLPTQDQEDVLQEICLAILEDGAEPDRAIRRGIRRWKSTRDLVTVPQYIGKRFQIELRGELPENSRCMGE